MAQATSNTVTLTVIGAPNTPLSQTAAALAAGQSATTLADTGLTYEALYAVQWLNRFVYDSARQRAYLLGKKASSQGGHYWMLLYDEGTNSWTSDSSYPGTELGHVYESLGFDPAAAELYTGKWAGRVFKKIAPLVGLTAWTDPATSAYVSAFSDSVQPAAAWHPDLFGAGDPGLVVLHGAGTTGKVVAWRKQSDTWHAYDGTTHTTTNSAAYAGAVEYVRGGNYCVASFVPAVNGKTFRLEAGSGGSLGSAVEIAAPPVDCTYPNSGRQCGALLDSPAGGPFPYILEKNGTSRVWKLDGTSWVLKPYTHPFADPSNWAVASCAPLGVFWCKGQSTTTPSCLWRPND